MIFERLYLQIKGMRFLFYVPFIGYYGIIPISIFISLNMEMETQNFYVDICYICVPIFSVWWLCLMIQMFIEGTLKEIVTKKDTLINALLYWGLNIICFCPLLLVQNDSFKQDLIDLFIQMIVVSFFMNALTYYLYFSTGSFELTIFVSGLYIVLSNYSFQSEMLFDFISSFQLTSIQGMSIECFEFIIAGFFFWLLGFFLSKRRY